MADIKIGQPGSPHLILGNNHLLVFIYRPKLNI